MGVEEVIRIKKIKTVLEIEWKWKQNTLKVMAHDERKFKAMPIWKIGEMSY